MVRPFPAALAALLFSSAAGAGMRDRVVVIYENRSNNPRAVELLADGCFGGVLGRKGYEVVDGAEVKDFLEAVSVRRVDPLPAGLADRLALRFGAARVLAVVINFVLEAQPRKRGPQANPAVGISARLIGAHDEIVWRNSLGILADATPVNGGRDRRAMAIKQTVATGCERLLYTFPKHARRTPEAEKADPAEATGGPRFQLRRPVNLRAVIKASPDPKKP